MLQNPATKNVKSIFICHPCKMESHKKKKKRQSIPWRKINQWKQVHKYTNSEIFRQKH